MGLLSKLAVKAAKSAAKKAPKAVEKPRSPLAVKPPLALPAPPKPLALPAPGPGLPPLASKPRGGQWWADRDIAGVNSSPEAIARKQAGDVGYRFLEWQPDDDYGLVSSQVPDIPKEQFKVQDWLARALAKYYKNDFGAPDDPLRGLAERGLHYDPDMTPEKWNATVNSYLMEDPIQSILFPPNLQGGMPGAGSDLRGETLAAMPWLAKQPVTEKVYGISGGLDLEHFADEFYNALHPEVSGLPMNLAVRPESLDRMTFAQAAEHVGKINQYRVKEMERAALSAQESPAIQTFKEYPENNPRGLRWVELKAPEGTPPYRSPYELSNDELDEALREPAHPGERALREALEYEGNTMGHCVGGYCPDVMSGRSRIFSLRDARGEPHVTIETSPGKPKALLPSGTELNEDFLLSAGLSPIVTRNVLYAINRNKPIIPYLAEARKQFGYGSAPYNEFSEAIPFFKDLDYTIASGLEDIVQIKGKQNRAPKDDYLPFVQDFVKSQQWSNVGDLGNAGLVRLPDGRYITQQQYDEGLASAKAALSPYFSGDLRNIHPWETMAPYFEGFAIGGRVDADRCFCRHPMAVKR